jgi:predicted transcriptional regulator
MKELRTYRKKHNLSCAALGELLGVTRVTVFRWEDGSRKVAISLVNKVSSLTGIPRERLRPDVFGAAQ